MQPSSLQRKKKFLLATKKIIAKSLNCLSFNFECLFILTRFPVLILDTFFVITFLKILPLFSFYGYSYVYFNKVYMCTLLTLYIYVYIYY